MMAFCGNPLDRASERRTDPAWLAAQHGHGLFMPFWQNKPLVVKDRAGFLPWRQAWRDSICVFLGLDGAQPLFAVDVAGDSEPVMEDGTFAEMRASAFVLPVRDDDVREAQHVAPSVPAVEAEERVHADGEAQPPLGRLGLQFLERQHRVGRPVAPHFAVVDGESGLARDRSAHHREPERRVGQRLVAVRRASGRDVAHLREAERLHQLESGAKVAVVDRVERAAEDPDRIHAASGIPAMRAVRRSSSVQASPCRLPFEMRSARAAAASSESTCARSKRPIAARIGP